MSKHQAQIELCEQLSLRAQNITFCSNRSRLLWKITKKGEFFPYYENYPSEKVDLLEMERWLTDAEAIDKRAQEDQARQKTLVQKILTVMSKEDLEWLLSDIDVEATIDTDFTINRRSVDY